MQTKISVLGHFAIGKTAFDGQTVKTKIITEELQKKLGKEHVYLIDTYGGWKTLFKAPFQVISALKHGDNVLIFPAHNGIRVYAPLLSLFRRFFKNKRLHYVVIGGWLPEFLLKRKLLAKILKRFDGIYAETNTMKNALEEQGFHNVFVMPNCKKLTILDASELVYPSGVPYRLCTFSRVMREKGIEDAVNAVTRANNEMGETVYTLDIYGPVDENQIEWFNKLQTAFPQYVHYRGCVDSDKSVEVLKNYFALLFPTFYGGEGLAGTLIDAFSSGVPIIASDWKYNPEIVHEKVGIIYPTGNIKSFADILKTIADDPKIIIDKRQYCLQEAMKYSAGGVVRTIIKNLN